MLRLVLFLFGVLTLIGLVWHIGPDRIIAASAGLGPTALLVILLPSLLMYVLEAFGWRLTLGSHAARLAYWRLLAVRTAGETVNMTTPTAYVGGEPLKAFLLRPYHVPLVDGVASVVLAKTIMTIAEILFIVLGIVLGLLLLGGGQSSHAGLAAAMSVALLAFGTAVFVVVQRRGLFSMLLGALRSLRLRVAYLEAREEKLKDLDATIATFYRDHGGRFLLATAVFFCGWMAEALEVFMILWYLGGPVDPLVSVAIGGISVLIKGGTFFIPGSLGAQEAGNLALLLAFGYSDLTGITFALLRRLREIVWIVIGLGCLWLLGDAGRVRDHENAPPS